MWPLVTYSDCFEIVSTMTRKPDSFEVCLCFNTVILYHYTINNDYTRYSLIFAAPGFLDIVISTCL